MCCFRYFVAEQNAFCDFIEIFSGLDIFVLGLIPLVNSIDVDNSFTEFTTTPLALIKITQP
jgi:hypothetical protein